MDFIEQMFGVSPDGGSGVLEMVYVGVAVAVVLAIVCAYAVRRRRARACNAGR